MGFSLKSVTKSVSKPFKEVGKAIHWTDIRYPVVGAALAATGVGLAGYGALTATGLTGAAIGAGLGQQVGAQNAAIKAQNAAAQESALGAQRIADALNSPSLGQATPPQQSSVFTDFAVTDARKRYSLQRTVNNYSLRGSLGGNRYSLG